MNHFNFPFINPFKMVPSTSSPGVHFDDKWACERIKWFEARAYYRQKWVKSNTTKLQIESSIAPDDLKLYNAKGELIDQFEWTAVYSGINYTVYETTFDVSAVNDGVYYLYQRAALLSIDWKAVSEPIHIKTSWPKTMLITYRHSFNDYDVAWSTGIDMKFRVEAAIMGFEPKRERTDYINQVHDTATLKGTPYREFVFEVGEAPGVAEWVVDLLNRIFCCDWIDIEGMNYLPKSGSEGKVTRIRNYPLIGYSQDIVAAKNAMSLQFADTTPIAPGLVTAYNIETAFFGPGALVPITDIEQL